MAKIKNISATFVDGDLLIAGEKEGLEQNNIKIGSKLTDGENYYEIIGLPFVRYVSVEAMRKNISLQIKSDNVGVDDLQGKTLILS